MEVAEMSCCCPHDRSASRLFSRFAGRYRKRFEKKGFEPSQRQLLAGLTQAGYAGAGILEIGSGVGHLHQTLLEQGAAWAWGIDLAPRMIAEARAWALERGLGERTHYLEGDFLYTADRMPRAEITILDKVVCCYPDVEALIRASLAKTGRVYALTYPRDRWFIRLGAGAGAFALWLMGSDFRAYVHSPQRVEEWVAAAGFAKHYEAFTSIWVTQVYVRGA
jgi:SAM-dependent methyltransferase